MKLIARKSMIALGTAAALSVTALTAPAMAEGETSTTPSTSSTAATTTSETQGAATTTSESPKAEPTTSESPKAEPTKAEPTTPQTTKEQKAEGDAYYSERYKLVEGQLNRYQASYDELKRLVDTRKADVTKDSEATGKIESARFHLNTAEKTLDDVRQDLAPLPRTGTKNDPEYGTLNALKDTLRSVNTELEAAKRDYDAAKPLQCDAKIAEEEGNGGNGSGFDSLSSGFGSLFDKLGSSGQMVIRKDGKPRCVSKAEYYSEKLTKVVAILGTVFTLITTMTKISDTIQKQAMPKN